MLPGGKCVLLLYANYKDFPSNVFGCQLVFARERLKPCKNTAETRTIQKNLDWVARCNLKNYQIFAWWLVIYITGLVVILCGDSCRVQISFWFVITTVLLFLVTGRAILSAGFGNLHNQAWPWWSERSKNKEQLGGYNGSFSDLNPKPPQVFNSSLVWWTPYWNLLAFLFLW